MKSLVPQSALMFLLLTTPSGCNGDDGDDGCIPGAENCECNMGSCLGGLQCISNICVQPRGTSGDGDGDDDPTGDGDGDPTGDGDGDPTGDGDPCGADELHCNGNCIDPMTDSNNCGSCGRKCNILNDIGGCAEGVCAPSLTECIEAQDPIASCENVCASKGETCAKEGCNTGTFFWYGSSSSCENFLGGPISVDCSEPTEPLSNYYRCCCQQP
jgi:hypothetical protein